MAPRRFATLGLLFCCSFSLHAVALDNSRLSDSVQCQSDWCASQVSLRRRQTPVIIAPPTIPRTSAYTPLIPQPTTSLNYWWPYGSNGVNPTSAPGPTPTSISMLVSSTMDDIDSDMTSAEEKSTTSIATSSPSEEDKSSSMTTPATTTTSSTSESSSETETPEPDLPEERVFKITSLLPLFIILGVLALATLVGWTYGRCFHWCHHRKEPKPGSRDIGGQPYEFGGFGSNNIGSLRSAEVGWADVSRMNEKDSSAPVNYHPVGADRWIEEPGTPSKSKPRTTGLGGWFRHTLSRKNGLAAHSPSGEKGLGPPLASGLQDGGARAPVQYAGTFFQTQSSPSLEFQSPKGLRVVNGTPSTLATGGVRPPATSAQPTPRMTASRHGSIRRKIVRRVRAEDEEDLLAATGLPGAFPGFDDNNNGYGSKYEDDWAKLDNDPLKESPTRRYFSNNTSPVSPRSPNPQEHRARMRRLRVAAESGAIVSDIAETPSQALDLFHPLPPASAVLLSPPLQPHLFFTGHEPTSQHDATPSDNVGPPFARSNRSYDLKGRSKGSVSTKDDPFGPDMSVSPTRTGHIRRTKRVNYSSRRARESTETLPLSPELRGAAMTRFEQIVKTNWSMRNLAGVPQSPTLYGALSPSETQRAQFGDEEDRAGIEDVLLAHRSSGRV
ncbi:hypothetical protein BDV93DRAFT_543442 [Ceratobasidium sp. AG-I]|nr:hypothetical protein BDV93DRAFT_543442 [Ceratobasidium sp. AG-I]